MLDRAGTAAYDLAGAGTMSGLAIVVVAAFVLAVCAITFVRGAVDRVSTPLVCGGTVVLLALIGWWVLEKGARNDLVAEQRALDARTLELTARAIAPGSALACLDAIAGEDVEAACEKAVFATPETTAAAVSYVAAQLSLLAATANAARRGANVGRLQAGLRRTIETDRFGIVAYVLAVRDGCTPARCSMLALVGDPKQLRTNLAERRYETLVRNHMAAWPTTAAAAVAGGAPATGASTAAAAAASPKQPQKNLYFPSSSSIPSLSIMTAEPALPAAQDGVDGQAQQRQAPANSKGARPNPNAPLPLAPTPQ